MIPVARSMTISRAGRCCRSRAISSSIFSRSSRSRSTASSSGVDLRPWGATLRSLKDNASLGRASGCSQHRRGLFTRAFIALFYIVMIPVLPRVVKRIRLIYGDYGHIWTGGSSMLLVALGRPRDRSIYTATKGFLDVETYLSVARGRAEHLIRRW
jgi:hypothetical protein